LLRIYLDRRIREGSLCQLIDSQCVAVQMHDPASSVPVNLCSRNYRIVITLFFI
jgi:hypothetical protein